MNREAPHRESCLAAAAEHGPERIVQIDKTAEFVRPMGKIANGCWWWWWCVRRAVGYELWSGARAMRVFIDDSSRSCLVHIHAKCARAHAPMHAILFYTHMHTYYRTDSLSTTLRAQERANAFAYECHQSGENKRERVRECVWKITSGYQFGLFE